MSLFRTKSIEQSIADAHEPGHQLKRSLTAWDLMILGVAVAVGAGIFSVGARAAGDFAGPAVTVAFMLAALACALAIMCYAEFASTIPVAGSAYTYTYATLGEFLAWHADVGAFRGLACGRRGDLLRLRPAPRAGGAGGGVTPAERGSRRSPCQGKPGPPERIGQVASA